MTLHRTTSPAIAFAVAALAVGIFSLMDAAMKDLSIALGAYNAVLWRNLTGSLIAGTMFVATGQSLTFGEMQPAAKHAISHRAAAFAKLKK